MRSMRSMIGGLTAAALFVLGTVSPAAAHVALQATLDSVQEVPPPDVDSPAPTGTAELQLLPEDGTLEFQITFQNLTGPPVAAHVHEGALGVPGAVVITLDTAALASGSVATSLTEEQLATLFDGGMYVNIHTARNPGGEIRGQIGLVRGSCPCDAQFKRCVKSKIRELEPAERKEEGIKALRRAVRKASCGKSRGPRKAIACCLPQTPEENIVTGRICAPIPERACAKKGGTSLGAGSSCFPTSPCTPPASPSGAFLDDLP
jgi:hypothetical protein